VQQKETQKQQTPPSAPNGPKNTAPDSNKKGLFMAIASYQVASRLINQEKKTSNSAETDQQQSNNRELCLFLLGLVMFLHSS
jgi:hypothetical protein